MKTSVLKSLQSFWLSPPSRSIGLIFLINGLIFGTWITRIPEIKEVLSLSESDLGIALFMLPLGALLMMPMMGNITGRFGAGRASLWFTYAYCLTVIAIPFLNTHFLSLCFILFIAGMMTGAMDIAMNAAAAVIEGEGERPIMSACHGFWSVGGMIGSGIGGYLYGIDFSMRIHFAITSLILIVLALSTHRILQPVAHKQEEKEPLFALPGKALLALAVIAFCIMFAEGVVADWSTLYLAESLDANPRITGLGYAAFAAMMALGRFLGDSWVENYGERRILWLGISLAGLSMLALLLLALPWPTVIGLAIVGLGFSNLIPIAFSLAAKTPGAAPGTQIAAIGSLGYFGLLAGPPAIGFIAEELGLGLALGSVILLSAIAMLALMLDKQA